MLREGEAQNAEQPQRRQVRETCRFRVPVHAAAAVYPLSGGVDHILRMAIERDYVDADQDGDPYNTEGQGQDGVRSFLSAASAAREPVTGPAQEGNDENADDTGDDSWEGDEGGGYADSLQQHQHKDLFEADEQLQRQHDYAQQNALP